MFRLKSALGSVGLVSATLLLAAPAQGAVEEPLTRVDLADGTDDVWSYTEGDAEDDGYEPAGSVPTVDVTDAVVAHQKASVVVRVDLVNLKRVHFQQLAAFVRTRDGLLIGLVSTAPGHRAGSHVLIDYAKGELDCPGMTHDVDYVADRVAMRIPRSCLDRPRWVRASVMNSLYKEVDGAFNELTDNPHNATSVPGETRRLFRAQ